MSRELVILSHVCTDAINRGFIPAAREMGLSITLLTDCAAEHRRYFSNADLRAYPDEIIACDVFNPIAVIELLSQRKPPAAIFSNSDHLQTQTALAAQFFALPGKDWRVCYRAKNKAAMRGFLRDKGIDALWHRVVQTPEELSAIRTEIDFPCMVKPREGVASRDVRLVETSSDLQRFCLAIWEQVPDKALLLESYLPGELVTLETLGDGSTIRVLGGFQVTLSPPPYFVELAAVWRPFQNTAFEQRMLEQIRAFGIQFGACHSEFVVTPDGPRLIEINYRCIGDGREFLLQETLQLPLFKTVLALHLGVPLPEWTISPTLACIHYLVASRSGTIQGVPHSYRDKVDGNTIIFEPLRQQGDRLLISHSNKDYLGVLKGIGQDQHELQTVLNVKKQHLEREWEIEHD